MPLLPHFNADQWCCRTDSKFLITACDDMHSHLYDIEHASLVEAFSGVLPPVAVPSVLLLTCLLQFNAMHLLSPGHGHSAFTWACPVKVQPLLARS